VPSPRTQCAIGKGGVGCWPQWRLKSARTDRVGPHERAKKGGGSAVPPPLRCYASVVEGAGALSASGALREARGFARASFSALPLHMELKMASAVAVGIAG
jgi:hypothetical protein